MVTGKMKYIQPGALLRALRRGGESPAFPWRGVAMGKSAKASARVTAAGREATAADQESRHAARGKAIGSGAIDNAARRQFQKTQATAIQAHVRARGQRQQAKRDSR